jgi:threonine/homoserine/homoserine lactone efflux protein
MRQALEGHRRSGLQLGLGASTMDTLYALSALFASSVVILPWQNTGTPWLMLLFQGACIATLIVLSTRYLKANAVLVATNAPQVLTHDERVQRLGFPSDYLMGIGISITCLASPTFLPSLIAVAGFVHDKGFVDASFAQSAMYALGFGSGAALWLLVVLCTAYTLRAKLPEHFIARLYQCAGWSFVLFAAILTYYVVVETQWSEW